MAAVTLLKDASGNYILLSDQEYDLPLVDFSATGGVVPMPAGDVQSVAVLGPHNTAVTATIGTVSGTTQPSIHVLSNVIQSDTNNGGGGFNFSLTDTGGLPMAASLSSATFVVSPDLSAATEGVDFSSVQATPNTAPPAAPGP